MAIGIADKLEALTVEGIVADSTAIAYTSGDTSVSGNTIADQITKIVASTVYLTEDAYTYMLEHETIQPDVEYNIIEE